MLGGGSKRDNGLPTISSTNIFAALESRKKNPNRKKKSDKEKQQLECSAPWTPSGSVQQAVPLAWAPTPVSVTSWADCEEEDDEYFAMPALPPLSSLEDERLHCQGAQKEEEEVGEVEDDEDEGYSNYGEESEGYDKVEEGNEENREPDSFKQNQLHTGLKAVAAAREPDRQLSKKELKKKGLAELEAALAELGLNHNIEKGSVKTAASKDGDSDAAVNSQPQKVSALAEGKSFKRRKAKKEKSFKEGRNDEAECQAGVSKDEKPASEGSETTLAGPVDKTQVLKKLTSMKKKKSVKDGDSAAKAAAAEAAVRAVKLAAAKKKEKIHYNQQPGR